MNKLTYISLQLKSIFNSSCLSQRQMSALQQTKEMKFEELRTRIREEVEARGKSQKLEATPVLKMRVVDLSRDAEDTVSSGILTIWRPGNSWASLSEGDLCCVRGCQVSRVEGHTQHLTANKNTTCCLLQSQQANNSPAQHSKRTIRALAALTGPRFRPQFSEVDTVVAVVSTQEEPNRLVVAVTDVDQNLAYLVAWGPADLRSGQTNVSLLQVGNVLSCKNLEWRQGSSQNSLNHLPCLHVAEVSLITLNPKEKVCFQQ